MGLFAPQRLWYNHSMTLEEQVGLQLAAVVPGTDATPPVIDALRAAQARSLVIFSKNFASADQFTTMIRRLEEGAGRRLLLMVDHEGGRIHRFKDALTHFPDQLSLERSEPSAIERQGQTEAEELRRLGITMNLAPCVDVLEEGCDPIIGDRSYGHEPERVAALAAARIRGLQGHGVAACAKHFPGLGAVPRDPHKLLPTIELGWQEMEEIHLPPFEVVIGQGVASVMSSHVCYPNLGEPDGLPATFSPRLIHGLLRERMQFRGAILTDALEMGALRTFGSIGESAVRAAEAGHDMFLICSNLDDAKEALSRLCEAYRSGRLSQEQLEASVKRIDQLRQNFLPKTLERPI